MTRTHTQTPLTQTHADDDRRDGTLLRAAEFRATLNDRSSLLTQRGLLSNTAAAAQQAGQGRGTRTRRSSQPQRGELCAVIVKHSIAGRVQGRC